MDFSFKKIKEENKSFDAINSSTYFHISASFLNHTADSSALIEIGEN